MTLSVLVAGVEEPLDAEGVETVAVDSVAAARDHLRAVDCVVSEYALADGTAFDLFTAARETAPDTPCLLWTDLSRAIPTAPGQPIVEAVDRAAGVDGLLSVVEQAVATNSHTAYPLPPAERDRLAALLDVAPESLSASDALDRLTRLAATHIGVPIAFVGVVDAHEERFISCQGGDWAPLDRQDTICTYTLLTDEPFAVEDVTEDPRVTAVEPLLERGIRSYLGVRLAVTGHAIGTFCVCDRRPRAFTDDARGAIRSFAAEASEQLELRYRLGEAD